MRATSVGWFAAAMAVISQAAIPAAARGPEPIFGILGGMMALAQVQAAQQAWANVSELRSYCLDQALRRQNGSIAALIQNGILPNDPRLGEVMAECGRFDPGRLRAGFSCTIRDDDGASVQTRCRQGFALQVPGQTRPLDGRGAIDAYFSGPGYQLVDIEEDRAREERLRRAADMRGAAELARLRVEVDRYLASRSEIVRREAAAVARRLADAGKSGGGMPATLRDQLADLGRLETREHERTAVLERVSALRDGIKRRAAALGPNWTEEERRLGDEFATASQPPAATSPTAAAASPRRDVGPTFDCAGATGTSERIVCASAELRRLDLELMQPYYLLRYLRPETLDALKLEAGELLRQTQKTCRLEPTLPEAQYGRAGSCIADLYRKQLAQWRGRLTQGASAAAREEATRPIEDHLALQEKLQVAGYLPADALIDGIFGGITRAGIRDFQAAEGLVVDGILSNVVAERLTRRSASGRVVGLSADDVPAQTQMAALAAVEAKYARLGERLAEAEMAARKASERQERVDAVRAVAAALPTTGLAPDLKAQVDKLRSDADAAATSDDRTLAQLADAAATVKARVAEAEALAAATTPRNAFLLAGGGQDLLVLANDTGKAPSVVRNLKGDLVFNADRVVGCALGATTFDAAQARILTERLTPWGRLLRPPLPRCDLARLVAYDLLFVKREVLHKLSPGELMPLLKSVDARDVTALVVVNEADQREVARNEADLVAEIDAGVAQRNRAGAGLVLLSRPGATSICLATPDAKVNGEPSLAPHAARLSDELGGRPTFAVTDVDAAFIAAKRGQCGAILADVDGLNGLTAAMRRDQIAFRYLPIWLAPVETDANRLVAIAGMRLSPVDARLVVSALTARNEDLTAGAPGDVTVLVNDSGRAPSVVRNLQGELVFRPERTSICLVGGGTLDVAMVRLVNDRLARWGRLLRLPLPSCDLKQIEFYDAVVLRRASFLSAPPADVVAVLKAVDAGTFSRLAVATEEDLRVVAKAEASRIAELAAGLEAHTVQGSGFVVLAAPQSATLCLTGAALEALVAPHLDRLADELGQRPSLTTMPLDEAFVAAKRGQCGAILADANGLASLTAALRRDQLGHRLLPLWIDDAPLVAEVPRFAMVGPVRLPIAAAQQINAVVRSRNAMLIDGAPDDVTVLVNDGGRAPSVVRNLKGDLVFLPARTSSCLAGEDTLDVAVARVVYDRLSGWTKLPRPPLPVCDLKQPDLYDLILLRRAAFLAAPPADVVAVLKAVDAGTLTRLASVTEADVSNAGKVEAARVAEIAAGLEAHSLNGAGVVVLARPQSTALCLALAGPVDAAVAVATPYFDRLTDEFGRRPTTLAMAVDEAFVAAKRGQCGAILAEADGLDVMMAALRRDQIEHRLLPLWLEPDALAQARRQVSDLLTDEQRRQMAERQRQEGDARVAAAKAADESVQRATRQAELRRRFGSAAKAFEDQMATDIRGYVEVGAGVDTRSSREFAGRYPAFSRWFQAERRDLWELVSLETVLADYGTGTYQGRVLEVGFAETRLKLRNRQRGEYRDKCVLIGFVDDKEFAVWRLPMEAECERAAEPTEIYKAGLAFESRWLAR